MYNVHSVNQSVNYLSLISYFIYAAAAAAVAFYVQVMVPGSGLWYLN